MDFILPQNLLQEFLSQEKPLRCHPLLPFAYMMAEISPDRRVWKDETDQDRGWRGQERWDVA